MKTELHMHWKVHSGNLLHEISRDSQQSIYKIPLQIFGKLLAAVGERAADLNDPQLNDLMCRLTVYTIADPTSPDYDPVMVEMIAEMARDNRLILKQMKKEVVA